MPVFYFHLKHPDVLPDVDGTDLASVDDALAHALIVARELMFKRDALLERKWSEWTMSIHDSHDTELFSFQLSDLETGKRKH
jgi:hypothetical protein